MRPMAAITGIRHAWSFDDMFSTFATQGLESKEKGKFTREELAPLAKVNVKSLKEFDYFTYATADGKKAELTDPAPDYWLDYNDQVLTLNFTLPFKKPVKAKELRIEIYDPTIFVDFSFDKQNPAQLVGAPKCKLDVQLPREMTFAEGKKLSEIPADRKEYDHGLGRAIREQNPGALSLTAASRTASTHCCSWSLHFVSCRCDRSGIRAAIRRVAWATSPEVGGFAGWILAKQAEFYRMLSGLIRAAKADGSAAYTLLGVSFLYGIFHAAGPGHGKAVISSYLVANNETWRRGIVLSFASAMLQAFTADRHCRHRRGASRRDRAKTMGDTVRVIEIVSYALDRVDRPAPAVGQRPRFPAPVARQTARASCARSWPSSPPSRPRIMHHHHDHEDDASAWGHAHAPEPQELTGRHWLRRGLAAIVAVGLRPCSGAIIVLVFALAQGLFWIGVASTFVMGVGTAITVAAIATLAVGARGLADRFAKAKPGVGMLLLRGLETAAALVIVLFGAALLTGYIVNERLMGV